MRPEGFETDNGPDLCVYLSTNPAAGPEGAFVTLTRPVAKLTAARLHAGLAGQRALDACRARPARHPRRHQLDLT